MSPPERQRRPLGGAAGNCKGLAGHSQDTALRLFDEDRSPVSGIPLCDQCSWPTHRVTVDGVARHSACEPRDTHLNAPETSHQAARSADRGVSSVLAKAILAELEATPDGLTDDELRLRLPGHPHGSYPKRRLDLVRAGRVIDSGRTRTNQWGRHVVVWTVTP